MRWLVKFGEQWTAKPLVARLTVLVTFLLTLGMIVSGTVMVSLLQRHLMTQIDEQLSNAAGTLAAQSNPASLSSFASDTASPTLYFIRYERLDINHVREHSYPSTITSAGRPKLPSLLPPSENLEPGTQTQPVTIRSDIPGQNWRAIAFAMDEIGVGRTSTIVTVALPLNDLQQTMRTTTFYFMTLGVIIVIIGGVGGSYMVRHALTGLRKIESTAGKIAAGDLTQRITPEPPTTEVGSLSRSLNIMLAQVEQAFADRQASEQKIRRFVSDASHELRTPLAAIRGYGELYQMGGVPDERIPDVMGRIHDEASRLGTLVDDLLTLARLDEGRPLEFSEVDLAKILDNAAFDLRALDPSRVVTLQAFSGEEMPENFIVCADRDRIQQVVTNLVGNIIRYTPKGSPIEILLGAQQNKAVIQIRDHGPGIKAADHERVFERFYRTEDSRARSLGGSGLGLSIVASILHAHHGSVALSRTEGGGLTVTIELPIQCDQIQS